MHFQDYFGDKVRHYQDSLLVKMDFKSPTVEYVPLTMLLSDFLHPTLCEMANCLEGSIKHLQMASEMLLYRYAAEAIQRRSDVHFIGETLMYNYAMFAAAARSSRAYCNGMRYSAHETVAAAALIDPTARSIEAKVLDIKHDRTGPSDELKQVCDVTIEKYKSRRSFIPLYSLNKLTK